MWIFYKKALPESISKKQMMNYPEYRTPCVDETVYSNREIYTELICNSMGIHVDPYLLRLTRKIKGDDRIILMSIKKVFIGGEIVK